MRTMQISLAAAKPEEVIAIEKALGVVFKGPFSDGREWDAAIRNSAPIAKMEKLGEIAKALTKLGYTTRTNQVNSDFAFKIGRNTYLSIDVVPTGIGLSVYKDE